MKATFFKRVLLAGVVLAGSVALRGADAEPQKGDKTEQIKWQANIYAAHDVAVETGKPILILVTGDACAPCKKLKTTTLADPRVVKYVNTLFVPVQLDFAKDSKVVEILEV